jgi:hypothetical protein
LWSTDPLFLTAKVTSPAGTTFGLKTTLNSVSVTCTTDEPEALSAVDPPFIATTATTPKTSAETATAIIIIPSKDFANTDSLTLLSVDSVDMLTSVDTPKRYATGAEPQLLYRKHKSPNTQQMQEHFSM